MPPAGSTAAGVATLMAAPWGRGWPIQAPGAWLPGPSPPFGAHGISRLLQDPGRGPRGHGGGHQEVLSPPGAQVPSRRQQGEGRRAEVQGSTGSLRGTEGPGEARRLRPARQRLEIRPAVPAAAGLGERLRVQRRHAAPGAPAVRMCSRRKASAISSRRSLAARARWARRDGASRRQGAIIMPASTWTWRRPSAAARERSSSRGPS